MFLLREGFPLKHIFDEKLEGGKYVGIKITGITIHHFLSVFQKKGLVYFEIWCRDPQFFRKKYHLSFKRPVGLTGVFNSWDNKRQNLQFLIFEDFENITLVYHLEFPLPFLQLTHH